MTFPRVVYAIRHEPTGKTYVGSTSELCNRLSRHFTALKGGYHSNESMQMDCNARGFSYSVFILDFIGDYQDKNKEFLWIDALGTRDPNVGYNVGDKSKTASAALRDGVFVGDRFTVETIQQLAKKCKKLHVKTGKSVDYLLGLEA